ncbi:hypothetical protein ALO45_04284 [Pseudomonas syringae pv. syringae]|nr:hypothetical protein ALO45_04284 [Pseudomonas syringae pv. syringae]
MVSPDRSPTTHDQRCSDRARGRCALFAKAGYPRQYRANDHAHEQREDNRQCQRKLRRRPTEKRHGNRLPVLKHKHSCCQNNEQYGDDQNDSFEDTHLVILW